MNRRGFISLLAGAAGAPFVPWRALIEPVILLPAHWHLITISGLYAYELAAPREWLINRLINQDAAYIRSDRLELLQEAYRKRLVFAQKLWRTGKGRYGQIDRPPGDIQPSDAWWYA